MREFLRKQCVCFKHAADIPCKGRSYSHEVVPAGFCRDAPLYVRRSDAARNSQVTTPPQVSTQDTQVQPLLEPDNRETVFNALAYKAEGIQFDENGTGVSGGDDPAVPVTTTTGDYADADLAALQPSAANDHKGKTEDGNTYPLRQPLSLLKAQHALGLMGLGNPSELMPYRAASDRQSDSFGRVE